jgi:hypothetical protein
MALPSLRDGQDVSGNPVLPSTSLVGSQGLYLYIVNHISCKRQGKKTKYALSCPGICLYTVSMELKRLTNFRLTPEALRILRALAQKYGLSMTGMLEMVLRDRARTEKLPPAVRPPCGG